MKTLRLLLVIVSITISGQLFANTTLALSVKGMRCGSCETKFKSTAKTIKGVVEVNAVSASDNNATIVYDEKTISSEELIATLANKTGYTVAAFNNNTASKPADACCSKSKKKANCSAKEKTNCTKK